MFLLLQSLENLAAQQSEDTVDQIREARVHCQYAANLVRRAVKPVQIARASAEVAKSAAAASELAANAARKAKAVAAEAFSTKNRFDLLSSIDD